MCGIVGWFNPREKSDEISEALHGSNLVQQLIHRGPTSQAFEEMYDSSTPFAMLGTARLAIVGVDDGEQPVQSPCGRWWVSMNGEIYNHPTLRRECLGNEIEPRNQSDTAVVAALLSFLPLEKMIERLRGMFALAIVDTQTQSIHIFRDRSGQKPLYWTKLPDDTLVWSSEIRVLESVHRQINLPLQYNQTAISHLLCFEYIPAPLSIWKGIHKLQPAHYLKANRECCTDPKPYWTFPTQTTDTSSSRLHWEQSLYLALRSATQLRLNADVEVGTLLSGGIDSTTITALAAEIHPNIRSFSVAIEAEGFSERHAIIENQEHIQAQSNLQSTLWSFTQPDFDRSLSELLDHMDEPLSDSSLVVTWFLFERIKEMGLRCVLSGDGADEIFAGYPTYKAAHWREQSKLPRLGLRKFIAPLIQRIPASHKGVSWEEMLKRWTSINQDGKLEWWREHQLWMGAWLPNELSQSDGLWDIAEFWSRQTNSSRVGDALFLDQRLYLAEGVLTKVDRASMAHSIEVRSPFLDHRIVELVSQIPLHFKLNRHGDKQILRSLLPQLSKNIQTRPKKGFGSPVAEWMISSCANELDALPEKLDGWIPRSQLSKIIAEHQKGSHNHRRRLWSAFILSEWMKRHPEI